MGKKHSDDIGFEPDEAVAVAATKPEQGTIDDFGFVPDNVKKKDLTAAAPSSENGTSEPSSPESSDVSQGQGAPSEKSGESQKSYDTKLSIQQQRVFNQWKSRLPSDLQNGSDYDLQGLYKSNPNIMPSANLHFPDTYKKPNHFTFSDESIYSTPEHEGGKWKQDANGRWMFYASPFNLTQHTPQQLEEYFKKYEPDSKLVLPSKESQVPSEKSGVDIATKIQGELQEWSTNYKKTLEDQYKKQVQREVDERQNAFDKELKSKYTPGTPEFLKARSDYLKRLLAFQKQTSANLLNVYNDAYSKEADKQVESAKAKLAQSQQEALTPITKPSGFELTSSRLGQLERGFLTMAPDLPEAVAVGAQWLDRQFGNAKPIEDYTTYQYGQKLRDLITKTTYVHPSTEHDFWANLFQGAGQAASYAIGVGIEAKAESAIGELGAKELAGGVVSKEVPSIAKTAAKEAYRLGTSPAAILGGAQMGVSEFDQAKAAGMSDEDAFKVYLKNYLVGTTMALPIENALHGLDKVTGNAFVRVVKKGVPNGLVGVTQMGAQNYISNQIAKGSYDPDRDPFFKTLESAGIGGILSFVLSGVGEAARKADPETQARILRKSMEVEDKAVQEEKKRISLDPDTKLDDVVNVQRSGIDVNDTNSLDNAAEAIQAKVDSQQEGKIPDHVTDLAQRIANGEKTFSAEDLQTQQNFPKELKSELKRINNSKPEKNALRERSTTQVLQRQPGETGEPGSGRGRVEPSEQGLETSETGKPQEKGSEQPLGKEQKVEKAKDVLASKFKGDRLADLHDLTDELSDNGAEVNEDGTVTLYHRTTEANKNAIEKSGLMKGEEDGVFFSTSENGQANGHGDAIVKLKVPIEKVEIDDAFGNEAHVRIPTKKAGQSVNVKKFISAEPKQKVFVYGTLKNPETRKQALGEDVPVQDSSTKGQIVQKGDKLDLGSGEESVPGQVMELTPEQVKKLDSWESNYQRQEITLDNGEKAQVYRLKNEGTSEPITGPTKGAGPGTARTTSEAPIAETGANEPPKPPAEEKPADNGPEPQKERKFAKQILEDANISDEIKQGLSEDAKNYIPKGVSITNEEAKAIIDTKGVEQAHADYLDRTNDMSADTRAVLGQNLLRRYNELKDFDNAVKIADNLSKFYTDLGRAVNAAKVFEMLTPEGVLRYVSKEVTKSRTNFSRRTSGERQRSKAAVDRINRDAVEKVLKNPKVKDKIISEVKKGRIKQAIDFLEKLKVDTKGKALDVTYGLTAAVWNGVITTVQKGLEAGLTISQAIEKALRGIKKKNKDFDEEKARGYLSDQLKGYRTELDPKMAIKEELSAQNQKIEDIIRQHYTQVDETKRTLIDKLTKEANVDPAEAKAISEELSKQFDEMTRSAKEKALNKYLPGAKKGRKAGKKSLVNDLIAASNLGALSDEQYRDAISEKIGVKGIDADQAKALTELADKVQKAPEGFAKGRATQELLTYISKMEGYSAMDVGMSIWYANVLSGVSTQILNISANFAETMGEAFVSAVRHPLQFPWIAKGLFNGWGRGILEMMDTLQHGFHPTKYEQKISASPVLEQVKFKGGAWNPFSYLKHVTRVMSGADIFAYHGLNEMRARELAIKLAKENKKMEPDRSIIRQARDMIYKGQNPWTEAFDAARQEGWKGRDLKRRAYEILEQQRPEFVIKDSNDAATRGTFNYEPEGTLGALTSLVNMASEKVNIKGLKPIKFIVPFTKIVANVTNRYLDWTPVGLLRAAKGGIGYDTLGESYHRKYTPEERAKVLTKAISGILAFSAMYALTDEDNGPFKITADGTGDVFKNYELQETGWRPYSIKIGDHWYEYKNTPLAIPFATLGFLRDLEKYRGQKSFEAKASIMLFGTAKYIMDLSFLQSLSSFFDTFSQNNTAGADSFFKKSATSAVNVAKSAVIPNAFTQISRAYQELNGMPIKRAQHLQDQLIRDIPVLRDHLGNIYDALGDPVVPNQVQKFIPLKPSRSTEDTERLWTMIADNSAWIGRPGHGTLKPNGESMTDEEYDKFSLLAGKLTKKALNDNYFELSHLKEKGDIQQEIAKLKLQARREARDYLFGMDY